MDKVIFCMPGKTFTENFVASWTDTLIKCGELNVGFMLRQAVAANVYHVRNACLDGDYRLGPKQKPFQGRVKYDYIMWIDSDQVWGGEDFAALLNIMRKHDEIMVLTAVYPRVSSDGSSVSTVCSFKGNEHGVFSRQLLSYEEIESMPELCRVDASGLGFCMMRYGAIESIDFPWFAPIDVIDEQTNKPIYFASEDEAVFAKLKSAGIDLWCATRVRVGHEKEKIFMLDRSE